MPTVVGATDELVYALLSKEDRSDYTKSLGRLVALDTATGAQRWSADVGPNALVSDGSLDGAGVLVVLAQGAGSALLGIDAADGTVRWRLDGMYQYPMVSNDDVVVVSDPSVAPTGGGPVTLGPDGSPPPLMSGQSYSGVDPASGAKLWSTMVLVPQDLDNGQLWGGAIDDGIAVVGPGLAALDALTGAELWSTDEAPNGGATGYDGVVAFAGQEGPDVTVVNTATGEQIWTAPGKTPYGDVNAIGDSAVYVLDGNEMVAYEVNSGAVRWRQPQDPVQLTHPWHATEDTLFTMWWNLEARATHTGALRWTTGYPTKAAAVEGPRMASIASNSDIVAVGFVSGSLGGD